MGRMDRRRGSAGMIFLCMAAFQGLLIYYNFKLAHRCLPDGAGDLRQRPVDAVETLRSPTRRMPPLDPRRLTEPNETTPTQCPPSLVLIDDMLLPMADTYANRRIPRIVHQTSKSRCLAGKLANVTKSWRLDDHSYYFWDDEAVMRLFRAHYDEFPSLRAIAESCLPTGTLRADLWRYLVLYTYGGVYADIDSRAVEFDGRTIQPDDDAWFVVDMDGLLSQYFMATSPRHPILYFTIQRVLHKVYEEVDTGKIAAPGVTGPHALARGFQKFLKRGGYEGPAANCYSWTSSKTDPCVSHGTYVGFENRSVTVAGDPMVSSRNIVKREAINRGKKRLLYSQMNMTHFLDERDGNGTGISCIDALRARS